MSLFQLYKYIRISYLHHIYDLQSTEKAIKPNRKQKKTNKTWLNNKNRLPFGKVSERLPSNEKT